jgi:uncharacterized repeat protein (TIGR03837 family)
LTRWLADRPTLVALTPGPAQAQFRHLQLPAGVRTHHLPFLNQHHFDRLLWSADLNLVRGEESLVRALWAGRPFLWQLYPQDDDAHLAKSAAFLDFWLGAQTDGPAPWKADLRALWKAWNPSVLPAGPPADDPGALVLPDLGAWETGVLDLRRSLLEQDDLTTQLMRFVALRQPAQVRAESSLQRHSTGTSAVTP